MNADSESKSVFICGSLPAGRQSVLAPKAQLNRIARMAKKKTSSEGQARKHVSRTRKPPAAAPQSPLIDTSLAAEAAARMLASKARLHIDEKQVVQEMGKETPSFNTLKESLSKPASQVMAALGNALGPSKSNLPIHSGNQVVHNQTTGGVSRVNVPRRTAG